MIDVNLLKKMREQSEMVFIGPYSDTCRFIDKVTDEYVLLDNGNRVALSGCEPTDFALVTRVTL